MTHDWDRLRGETILDKYVVGALTGESDGVAFFAPADRIPGTNAAIRMMRADHPGASSRLSSWQLAAQIPHRNLLRVFDAGLVEIDEIPYVAAVVEQPEESVAEVLPTRTLTADETRDILSAIVPAVKHLHGHGAVHGALAPASIVASDDCVKLSVDSLSTLDRNGRASSLDVRALGATVVELMTNSRPEIVGAAAAGSLLQTLAPPLRQIASGTLDVRPERQWDLDKVENALAGETIPAEQPRSVQPSPVAVRAGSVERRTGFSIRKRTLAGVAAAVLLVITASLAFQGNEPEPSASAQPSPQAASRPPLEVRPDPFRQPQARPPEQPKSTAEVAPGWAVVTAAYNNYEAADKLARSIHKRWSRFEPAVYPSEGKGAKYMVILGSGLSQSEADRLKKKARAAGLPRDTYATKL